MTPTRVGGVVALLGFLLIMVGLFSFGGCARPDLPCPSPTWNEIAAYLGLVMLLVGLAILVWSGWRGSAGGWALAAAAAVPATWFAYEILRQSGCPLIEDAALASACLSAYGEMTAPVLSSGAAVLLLLIGWRRTRRLRSPA